MHQSLSPQSVVNRLMRIDGRIKAVWGPLKVSGLYKLAPGHPDSNAVGLRWIGAIASPRWFSRIPVKDFFDSRGEYHRGWMTTVSLLVAHGHITKEKAVSQFGKDWLVPGIRGKLSALPGWNEKSSFDKLTERFGTGGEVVG
jgi:hypothetical protein